MQYTSLGRTGLKVSRLCLGTMNFGHRTTEADSFAIMDRALEAGVRAYLLKSATDEDLLPAMRAIRFRSARD